MTGIMRRRSNVPPPIVKVPVRKLPSYPRRTRFRRSRFTGAAWVLAAVIVLILAGGGVFLYRTMNQPAELIGSLASVEGFAGPTVRAPAEIVPTVPGYVSTLRGLTDDAVSLTANGEGVQLDEGGGFALYLLPEWTEVRLVATDASGVSSETLVSVTPTPTPAEHPATTAVHVRASDWANPAIHQQVLDLIAQGRINAVQLDIKDESGHVGYASNVPLAQMSGAAQSYYDARQAIDELHGLGVRVIGRLVNFFDPTLARWAMENGRNEMIVLDPAGTPLVNTYGSAAFTNFADPDVRKYQIDLATEAVSLGFDEILYDYVRRPEGDIATMQFPGLVGPPDVSIARFVADTKAALGDTMLGVSVFGISASRPEPTAQDMALLGPLVDYVSPMVYPALWTSGEYGVPDPPNMPYEIVSASLADFQRILSGSGAAVVPWLQDFGGYGAPQVQAQIDAARANGSVGFLLWNPTSTYSPDGIPPAG